MASGHAALVVVGPAEAQGVCPLRQGGAQAVFLLSAGYGPVPDEAGGGGLPPGDAQKIGNRAVPLGPDGPADLLLGQEDGEILLCKAPDAVRLLAAQNALCQVSPDGPDAEAAHGGDILDPVEIVHCALQYL